MKTKPSHSPTQEQRQLVQLHACVGTPHAQIGRILNLDPKTLRKYYREELDLGLAKANATIGGALFNKAKGGDTASMIFWLKTRAGWRERTEVSGPDGGPIQTQDVGDKELARRLALVLARGAHSKSEDDSGSE